MKKSLSILVFFLVIVFLHFYIAAENKTDSSNNISQAEKAKKIDEIFSTWSKPGSPGAAIAVIEKGKLTAPVKQATLIGSNIDILQKIEMIGTDLKFGLQTGTCGKDGQAAPVTDGCPTLKIIKMTVGGQN